MAHNRKIVLGGSSLTMARTGQLKMHEIAPEVMEKVERIIVSSGYLDKAPFKWVGLILRYGIKNEHEPTYERISKKHGDLPLAIELDTRDLLAASRDELKRLITIATLKSLIHAGKKYELPTHLLEEQLLKEKEGTSVD